MMVFGSDLSLSLSQLTNLHYIFSPLSSCRGECQSAFGGYLASNQDQLSTTRLLKTWVHPCSAWGLACAWRKLVWPWKASPTTYRGITWVLMQHFVGEAGISWVKSGLYGSWQKLCKCWLWNKTFSPHPDVLREAVVADTSKNKVACSASTPAKGKAEVTMHFRWALGNQAGIAKQMVSH